MLDLRGNLARLGIVPVIRLDREEDAVPLAAALKEAGLPCAEITFRTAAAEEAIRRIASQVTDVLVGAGTVLKLEQAERAADAGARFIVSPGFDPGIVNWCLKKGMPVLPGVATPTEIIMGLDRGLEILKFYPAELLGGLRMLKAFSEVFPGMGFVPTGGVSQANLGEYLKAANVVACAGSWLVKSELIAQHDFAEITRLAAAAREVVLEVRPAQGS